MKLLVVAPYFYPKTGGLENYAFNIAKGLKQKYGWEVSVVCANHKEQKYLEETIEGMKIYRLPYWFKLSNTPINPFWFSDLEKIIENEKPDVINAHTPVPFIADLACRVAKKKRIQFVLTYHNDLVKENYFLNKICQAYYLLLGNRTLILSDKIIATSQYYAEKSPYLRKHLKKIGIVSPGVDTSRFNDRVDKKWLKKKYGLEKNKVVLFVGQLDKTHSHKGLDLLIESIALTKKEVPEIRLMIVGKGDWIEHYKETAKKVDLSKETIFTGFVSDEELPKYYAGADLTALTPTTDAEGFGMTLLESGACGTPPLGTNIGGVANLLRTIGGYIVEKRTLKETASALKEILKKGKKKIDRAKIMELSWKILLKKTRNILVKA